MLRNIAFDLGGVILRLDYHQAVARFEQLGLANAKQHLDIFVQRGIFGQLEDGTIDSDTFRQGLSQLVGHDLSHEQCAWAIQGYVGGVDTRALHVTRVLRERGFRICLLSNTNPFMMQWAESSSFSPEGMPVSHFFDALYLSYQMKTMKPRHDIFTRMLDGQHATATETLFVDDSETNLKAAEELGIHTLLADEEGEWMQKLLITAEKLAEKTSTSE